MPPSKLQALQRRRYRHGKRRTQTSTKQMIMNLLRPIPSLQIEVDAVLQVDGGHDMTVNIMYHDISTPYSKRRQVILYTQHAGRREAFKLVSFHLRHYFLFRITCRFYGTPASQQLRLGMQVIVHRMQIACTHPHEGSIPIVL